MPDKLKQAIARGAKVTKIAKLVEVSGLGAVVKELQDMATVQQIAYIEQNKILVEAIDRLVNSINEKEFNVENKTDVSALVKAVASLKHEAMSFPEPSEWQITADRDQRHLIDFEKGIRLSPIPKVLN